MIRFVVLFIVLALFLGYYQMTGDFEEILICLLVLIYMEVGDSD